MPTHQIPRDRWGDYLGAFSAHNQTRHITVEMDHSELGPQTLVEDKPLLALEQDLKDENEPAIVVVAGDPEGAEPESLRHRVMDPQSIWVKEDDDGRAEALDIEMEEGRTVIRLS